jgi:hypothetical protein
MAKRAVPENLGNGLDKLVETNLAIKAGAPANFGGIATAQAGSYSKIAGVELQAIATSPPVLLGSNDNGKDATNSTELITTRLRPTIDPAVLITLGTCNYRSIVHGVGIPPAKGC